MGDDTQIEVEGKCSIKLENGVFKNILYVPFLTTNLLYVYQMTHTGSPKQVVFSLDLVEISNISTRKMIEKGVANHASKAYDSHAFCRTQI